AQGDEVAFIIGLFEDDASATFELVHPSQFLDQSSYFIDDVTVVPVGSHSQPCGLPTSVQVYEATSPLMWYDAETRVISLRDDVEGNGQLVIYDLTGRLIETDLVSHSRHFNVSHLPTGSYMVALQVQGMRKSVERIVVY
ncbi:MAG: T9SS type A sorting domain-containing protein, partial [Flavobacteriales bacterium]